MKQKREFLNLCKSRDGQNTQLLFGDSPQTFASFTIFAQLASCFPHIMPNYQINFASLFFIIGFALISQACQPIPAKQMELIRERFRTATVLFPPPELQNLTETQMQVLNKTIDQLIRLQSSSNSIPFDVEQNFLLAMKANAEQLTHG